MRVLSQVLDLRSKVNRGWEEAVVLHCVVLLDSLIYFLYSLSVNGRRRAIEIEEGIVFFLLLCFCTCLFTWG